jgi:hypothetical protein
MAATTDAPAAADASSLFYDTWLDWIILALFAVEGLVAALLGVNLATGVDREFAENVAVEVVAEADPSIGVSEQVIADAVQTVAVWVGGGFVVAGLLTVAIGVWFRRYRVGVRDRVVDGQQAPRWHAPLLGGLLATALLFVPFVQLLGGGVAGYLSDRSGILDGALAGVVFGAPGYVGWVAVLASVLLSGIPSATVLFLFAALVYLVADVVLAAVGGLVGGLLS